MISNADTDSHTEDPSLRIALSDVTCGSPERRSFSMPGFVKGIKRPYRHR